MLNYSDYIIFFLESRSLDVIMLWNKRYLSNNYSSFDYFFAE